jgi:alpha 1,2-mannosyltransferase
MLCVKGTQMFAAFVRVLDRFFNNYYQYPLIVFFEATQVNQTELAQLRNASNSPTFFQPLVFTLPPFINLTDAPLERCRSHSSQGIGYKHMCRFQAKTIYEQPIMQAEELEYVWRLDDDSFLRRNVTYDPFRFMKERGIRYGFIGSATDNACWTVGLWKAASDFFDRLGIKPKRDCRQGVYYYNNFELSALSLWRSPEYKAYIEYIDRLGGIYYYRWGDATIKTLAVSRLLNGSEVAAFRNIGYRHNIQTMT